VKCTSTHCGELASQDTNLEGHNDCINCENIVPVPPERKVPTWVWGVVVALLENWQILRNL
jgi:hypothetical protein